MLAQGTGQEHILISRIFSFFQDETRKWGEDATLPQLCGQEAGKGT
jgi:hypothetical protein